MLAALVCNCSGSENLVRNVFRKVGLDDWLTIPVYHGKKGYIEFKQTLPQHILEMEGFSVLDYSMNKGGTYALIVGYNNNGLIYTNVKRGNIESQINAEAICEKFA